jgi:drug/metabolite transporter (DMT)-like permease
VKTPLHSILYVFVAALIGSFGAVFLKMGAVRLHRELRTLLLNWHLGVGVGLYLLSFVFYYMGLRDGELSVVFPMVSLGYIWTLVWSRMFFGEVISRRKVLGLGLIICGILILNLGNR